MSILSSSIHYASVGWKGFKNALGSGLRGFTNSKVGKILFGNAFNYTLSIVSASIMLAGLFTPVSPVIIVLATASLIGAATYLVNDVLKVRRLRNLHREHNLFLEHRKAVSEQEYILNSLWPESLSPKFSPPKWMKVSGLQPTINKGATPESKHHMDSKISSARSVANIAAQVIPSALYFADAAASVASANVGKILKATTYGLLTGISLINGTLTEQEIKELKTRFKEAINKESQNVPPYKNLDELERIVKSQVIQTLALRELIKDPNKIKAFEDIKNSYMEKYKKRNVFQDFADVLNPFYELPRPSSIEKKNVPSAPPEVIASVSKSGDLNLKRTSVAPGNRSSLVRERGTGEGQTSGTHSARIRRESDSPSKTL